MRPSPRAPSPPPQLRDLEGGVALPAAQEPAQDRVDDRLPPRQQEGCLGGGGQEALAQDGQAPAWCRRRDAQAILAKRNQQPAVRAAQRCVSLSLALLLLLRLARGADSSVARPPRLSARLALFIRLPPTFPLDLSPRPAPSLRRSAAAVTEAKDKKKEREAQRKSQRASNKPVANAVPKGGKVGRGAR